jgi:hypothetical protein
MEQQKTLTPQQVERREQERRELLKKGEVSLWIDNYDDIFSDFDPRPYSQRALSDDFLYEAKKMARSAKEGNMQLRFLAPRNLRKSQQEQLIKKRLHEHFEFHHRRILNETKGTVKSGVILALLGFALMAMAAYLAHEYDAFWSIAIIVLFEPAGWFTVWYGFEKIFYTAKERGADLEFYARMSKAEIVFDSY